MVDVHCFFLFNTQSLYFCYQSSDFSLGAYFSSSLPWNPRNPWKIWPWRGFRWPVRGSHCSVTEICSGRGRTRILSEISEKRSCLFTDFWVGDTGIARVLSLMPGAAEAILWRGSAHGWRQCPGSRAEIWSERLRGASNSFWGSGSSHAWNC